MPNLTECCDQIEELVKAKDFRRDLLFFKLVWLVIEGAEALDIIKKQGLPDPTVPGERTGLSIHEDPVFKLAEEVVDTVFYACDSYRLLRRRYPDLISMDEMFIYKMSKNHRRPRQYGQQFIGEFLEQLIDHYHAEGLLDELIDDFLLKTGKLKNSASKAVG